MPREDAYGIATAAGDPTAQAELGEDPARLARPRQARRRPVELDRKDDAHSIPPAALRRAVAHSRRPARGNPGDAAGASAARRASSPASARSTPATARRAPGRPPEIVVEEVMHQPEAGEKEIEGAEQDEKPGAVVGGEERQGEPGQRPERLRAGARSGELHEIPPWHGTDRASARRSGFGRATGADAAVIGVATADCNCVRRSVGAPDAEGSYNVEPRTVRRCRPQPGRSLERPGSTFEWDSVRPGRGILQPGRPDEGRGDEPAGATRGLDRRRPRLEPGRKIARLHRSILGPKRDNPRLRRDSRRP